MDYKFTQDWFSHNIPTWVSTLTNLPDTKNFLEIGSFEGRSTVWIVENLMSDGGWIDCIDTWTGNDEQSNISMSVVEAIFNQNARTVCKKFPNRKIHKIKGRSFDALKELSQNCYDMIYIDGSHFALDVMTDACMAWPLLKNNGVMIFDDYKWKHYPKDLHNPKAAIDLFVEMVDCDVLHKGYQMIIKKRGTT